MEKKSLSCDNCSFEGQNQQELKRHVELKHRGNAHSFGKDTKYKSDINYKNISRDKAHSKEQGRRIWLWWPASWVPLVSASSVPLVQGEPV